MYFQANIYLLSRFDERIGMKNRVVEELNTEYHRLGLLILRKRHERLALIRILRLIRITQ
ncbi:hypothetical protein J53TS2_30770 [Paenibacillus sp. J53TS2]|nr:hypothetical protein J53TS2_30770 [Paenibacillus sp. J53TS2]